MGSPQIREVLPEASKKPMGALTLPAWKSFFKKYLNRSAAHLLTEVREIDPGVTAMLEQFQAPDSENDIKVGRWLVGFFGLWLSESLLVYVS